MDSELEENMSLSAHLAPANIAPTSSKILVVRHSKTGQKRVLFYIILSDRGIRWFRMILSSESF